MTRRRIIESGTVWALSRRTTRRHFLLTPDESRRIEQAYWYCLAYAAKAHGILVHAACLMSTHSHEVVTDVQGELPRFLQTFHRLLALSTKALRGWPEEVFNKRSSGAHALLSPDAIIESIAYLIANPVEALAVRYAKDWPGAQTLPRDLGVRTVRVKRPAFYFDAANSEWPDEIELLLEMPALLQEDYGEDLTRARIAKRVCDRERAAWQKARRAGIAFLGAKRVLRLSHTKRAKSFEVFGSLNPRFSAAGSRKAAAHAVRRLRLFNAEYDKALAAWVAGDRNVRFSCSLACPRRFMLSKMQITFICK